MPKKKIYEFDDDIIDFIEGHKKEFVNERNLVSTAIREFIVKYKNDRYEKMLSKLKLNTNDK